MAFKNDEKLYLLDLHSYVEGSPKKAVDLFNDTFKEICDPGFENHKELSHLNGLTVSYAYLRRLWRSYGLTSNGHGGIRNGWSDIQIKDIYNEASGDFLEMLSKYPFSAENLQHRCRDLGLSIFNIPASKNGKSSLNQRYRIFNTGRSRNKAPNHS